MEEHKWWESIYFDICDVYLELLINFIGDEHDWCVFGRDYGTPNFGCVRKRSRSELPGKGIKILVLCLVVAVLRLY